MKLYDWIAGTSSLGPSRILSADQSRALLPILGTNGLNRAVTYFDGQFDDARLGVTLVKSFAEAGGEVANYVRVAGFEMGRDGKLSVAAIADLVSGQKLKLQARAFVNATGPFSDGIRALARPGAPKRLVLSKGSHIILPLDPNLAAAMLIPATEDGRVIFAIPWLGRLLVGTTDEEAELNDPMVVTRGEAEFLLRHLNRYSSRPYRLDEIVSGFAGVRPLVRSRHASETRKLIRDHEVEIDGISGLISILGGKWTTYRAMAEDTIDRVQRTIGAAVGRCATTQHRLIGAEGYEARYWETLVREASISDETAHHLAGKHGTRALDILQIAKERRDLTALVVPGAPQIQVEIVHAVRHEMALTIEDVLARRIGLQYFDWRLATQAAPVVASHLARELAWTDEQKAQAIREYVDKIREMQTAIGLGRS
jgi:glycerol-3-phosphate dehydrogenase